MAKKFYVDGLTVDQILNMDPAEMAKLNKRDISRALRTVALAANKRIEKLEKYAKKTRHGYEPRLNTKKAIAVDALNWVTSDGVTSGKFGVRKSDTRNQMIAQIGRARQFMTMKSSTVTGAVNLRKMREKTLFGKTREQAGRGKSKSERKRTYKKFHESYAQIWDAYYKYREYRGQDPHALYDDSDRVLTMLGQYIFNGASVDEAVQQTIREMDKQYEEQQQEYEDLFGDDFTDFGNFNV